MDVIAYIWYMVGLELSQVNKGGICSRSSISCPTGFVIGQMTHTLNDGPLDTSLGNGYYLKQCWQISNRAPRCTKYNTLLLWQRSSHYGPLGISCVKFPPATPNHTMVKLRILKYQTILNIRYLNFRNIRHLYFCSESHRLMTSNSGNNSQLTSWTVSLSSTRGVC